jgi:hypothetical protein
MKILSTIINSHNFRFFVYWITFILIGVLIGLILTFRRLNKIEREEIEVELATNGVVKALANAIVKTIGKGSDANEPAYKTLERVKKQMRQLQKEAEREIRHHEWLAELTKDED